MKKSLLPALLFASSAALAAESNTTVTADGLSQFDGELIEIGYSDPRTDAGFEVLGIAVIKDGDARMEIPLSEPLLIELNLLAGEAKDGFKVSGIAEPGEEHKVLWDSSEDALAFRGGDYNSLIRAALDEPGEAAALSLRSIYMEYDDPVARLLALRAAWQDGEDEEQVEVMEELEAQFGESTTLTLLKVFTAKRVEELALAIRDFTALNLDGEEIRLFDVMSSNKYTLVEFWASWCGPCIAEIPHLKAAYERFREQGFEILAFNLDDEREAWRQASEDDYNIEWLNVSDELAFESPVAEMYRVNAIPASFLVRTDGVTVGRNLRGKNLEYRLEELLKEDAAKEAAAEDETTDLGSEAMDAVDGEEAAAEDKPGDSPASQD